MLCGAKGMLISTEDLEEVLGERKSGFGVSLVVVEKHTGRLVAAKQLSPAPSSQAAAAAAPSMRVLGESLYGGFQYLLLEVRDGGTATVPSPVGNADELVQGLLMGSGSVRGDRRRRRACARRSPVTSSALIEQQPDRMSGGRRPRGCVGGGVIQPEAPLETPLAPAVRDTMPRRQVYQTQSTAYYTEPGDPNPVLIAEVANRTRPTTWRPPSERSEVRLALVSMVRRPSNFLTWLEYHRRELGVERFYIRAEDSPELAEVFRSPPWDSLVSPTFCNGTQRDYFEQMDRQSAHIAAVIPAAREAGQPKEALLTRSRAGRSLLRDGVCACWPGR